MTYTETNVVETIEKLAGAELAELTQVQLDGIDQFHSGGAEAVDRLIHALRLEPGMTALDVGSGLGGPARQIARATGCTVIGVDITEAYVDAATALTDAVGLDDLVGFACIDVADVARSNFDAAYTIHVQMNVADKAAFFASIAARLQPGARFAVFDVCRTGDTAPALPLPWSLDGSDSFLATPDELCSTIEAAGFETVEWVDETQWVSEWFAGVGDRVAAAGTPATLTAVLDDGLTRVINFAAGLSDGVLTVHRGTFRRAG